MQDKEDGNKALYDQIKKFKSAPYKQKKHAQAALDALPAPDPSLPPFNPIENEPFGDTNSFKFNDDIVMEKLNDFADSTIKMGESLFRKISQSDFFSRSATSTKSDLEDMK